VPYTHGHTVAYLSTVIGVTDKAIGTLGRVQLKIGRLRQALALVLEQHGLLSSVWYYYFDFHGVLLVS
jgi:hypothetical protein